jgi:uncharacterized protein YjbJ (UPF0337 family)
MAQNRSSKVSGKVKETTGKVTGNKKMEAQGKREQSPGQAQRALNAVKDTLKKGSPRRG